MILIIHFRDHRKKRPPDVGRKSPSQHSGDLFHALRSSCYSNWGMDLPKCFVCDVHDVPVTNGVYKGAIIWFFTVMESDTNRLESSWEINVISMIIKL